MIFGHLSIESKPKFSYNPKALTHPFTLHMGELEFSMTEEQVSGLADLSNNVLIDYNEALKEVGNGKDKVNKLAEIIAGAVLAGELSLGAAISSSDWVSSHEEYGRNR